MGTLLTALIRQGDLTSLVSKICAYYIMQDLFQENGQNVETPFTPILWNTAETMIIVSKSNFVEKAFVITLLNHGTREVCGPH